MFHLNLINLNYYILPNDQIWHVPLNFQIFTNVSESHNSIK